MSGFYVIMEWTPFPGVFAPMATCHIQEAEFGIGGLQYYHEGAARIESRRDTLWLYPYERAQQIIKWTETRRANSKHYLIRYPGTISPVAWEKP